MPIVSAYCQNGQKPSFTGQPIVQEVDLRTVRVSWEGLVQNKKCVDYYLVKYWPKSKPQGYSGGRLWPQWKGFDKPRPVDQSAIDITHHLSINHYVPKMGSLAHNGNKAKMNYWYPWQLKKSKSWGPFWNHKLNSAANSAQLAHFHGKWAGLAQLSSW